MNEAQKKAWDCLKDLEQKSLFLQLSENKSSWEAGEILKLSHYKYLEVGKGQKSFSDYSRTFLRNTLLYFDQIVHVREVFRIILRVV